MNCIHLKILRCMLRLMLSNQLLQFPNDRSLENDDKSICISGSDSSEHFITKKKTLFCVISSDTQFSNFVREKGFGISHSVCYHFAHSRFANFQTQPTDVKRKFPSFFAFFTRFLLLLPSSRYQNDRYRITHEVKCRKSFFHSRPRKP